MRTSENYTEVAKSRDVQPRSTKPAKTARKAKELKQMAQEAKVPRRETKQAKVLELLRQDGGVTLDSLVKETGWQAHSVRGFISGQLCKKMGVNVTSNKREDGHRVYSVA